MNVHSTEALRTTGTPLPRYDTREHAVTRYDRPAEAHSGAGGRGNRPAEAE